jgi:S-adenosylmethionine:tRNA ribosyltransferase-isomerase
LLFVKNTGAVIEVFCLEPLFPAEYESSFNSSGKVEWKCIVGNLKKWKAGMVRSAFLFMGKEYELTAEKVKPEGDAWRIRFNWNGPEISFGEVIEATGNIPLPPYLNRKAEAGDITRYQTIYSNIKGSVAAPTAGLHFTEEVMQKLDKMGIKSAMLTLHVGAGTFRPVKSENISSHEMHCEHFYVTAETIELLSLHKGPVIPVGTTSVRALESLYWLGVKIILEPRNLHPGLSVEQWEVYGLDVNISVRESMEALLKYLKNHNLSSVNASTSIMIIPGYKFKMTDGMITNFHQPGSTLLLLVSAWIGNKWKKVYEFALTNDFRFLSYGDCSLLLK